MHPKRLWAARSVYLQPEQPFIYGIENALPRDAESAPKLASDISELKSERDIVNRDLQDKAAEFEGLKVQLEGLRASRNAIVVDEGAAKRADNVVDGGMPSDLGVGTTAELEEERRLLYDAGEGRSSSDRAAALLHLRPERTRRPPRLCLTIAVRPGSVAAIVRSRDLASIGGGRGACRESGPPHRYRRAH
jgi:hypothetical protein